MNFIKFNYQENYRMYKNIIKNFHLTFYNRHNIKVDTIY